jgi:hypothetical protein
VTEWVEFPVIVSGDQKTWCYEDIVISYDELLEASREASDLLQLYAQTGGAPSYRGPYMDLMLRAEAHFAERLIDPNLQKDEIEGWLNDEGPKVDLNWSARKSSSMATFLRHPDAQRGGAKRQRQIDE